MPESQALVDSNRLGEHHLGDGVEGTRGACRRDANKSTRRRACEHIFLDRPCRHVSECDARFVARKKCSTRRWAGVLVWTSSALRNGPLSLEVVDNCTEHLILQRRVATE
ncbi:hypothetical protein PsorP6_000621 [Peronosclerospora sorghi]|uniref:Uncharacterized protein n=1 Tax=Peronosclerospora sorghi TaxID=230839 RepID=A0ACC0WUK0_9STRA|nr:hypothetical protein PsorP6_000621 [Peronosclerospora sorghi]